MTREGSTKSEDPIHRQFTSFLGRLRPTDAAFVLHLARCERCRTLAEEFLPVGAAVLAPEREFILDLAGSLFGLVDRMVPQDDLSPTELRSFLRSLEPQQTRLIRHLLACPRCREMAARILAPQDSRPAQRPGASLPEVLQ
jgi:hypothetical protein